MIEGPYPIPAAEAEIIKLRISQAKAWCSNRLRINDPRGSLRSPRLEPARPFVIETPGSDGSTHYHVLSTPERAALVARVAEGRAGLLEQAGIACPPFSAPGNRELLVVQVDYSMNDGTSEDVSGGFFDVCDIPAWDTWVYLQRIGNTDVLLCWIPEALIERVNEA